MFFRHNSDQSTVANPNDSLSLSVSLSLSLLHTREGSSTVQRRMFGGLHALLKCKLALNGGEGVDILGGLSGKGGGGGGGGGMRGGRGGMDEAYLKAIDAQQGGGGGGGGGAGRGGGAPDVMTLEDRD